MSQSDHSNNEELNLENESNLLLTQEIHPSVNET